jgi:cbb3-type cytochrome oxidase maturation protein
MDIIFITVPVTLLFIATGVAIFFWANKGGQFDDLDSPAHRILFDDDVAPNKQESESDATQEDKETKDPTQ